MTGVRGRGPAARRRPGRARARAGGARRRARRLRGVPGHDPRGQAPAVASPTRSRTSSGACGVRDRLGRAARLQPAGRGPHPGARERRHAVHEAGATRRRPAGSSTDEKIRELLPARGPPHRGLPAARCRRTPTRGWAGASSTASARSSRSSRPTRPTSTGTPSPRWTRCCRSCATSAGRRRRSTASPTRAPTQPLVDVQVEDEITAVIGDARRGVRAGPGGVRREYGALAREDHRRFVDAFRNGMIPGVEADYPPARTLRRSVRRLPAGARASIVSAIERGRLVVRRSLTTRGRRG